MKFALRKRFISTLVILFFLSTNAVACDGEDSDDPENGGISAVNYRDEMRKFVGEISDYAKAEVPSFAIVPQNGVELFTIDGDHEDQVATEYLSKIDAVGQEDLFYGYYDDDKATPSEENEWIRGFLDIGKEHEVKILVTDYCSTPAYMDDSYSKSAAAGYISFAADSRDLDRVPAYPATPYNENSDNIDDISKVKNFLYLINPQNFNTKQSMLDAIAQTNYDLVLIDAFFNDETLTQDDITALKKKKNGASRLIICYMSIGEAENYRFYWDARWNDSPPSWMAEENPDWEGNFKVRYWDSEWKKIIMGNDDAYLDLILSLGFDGVYLDIIDAFEYFEE